MFSIAIPSREVTQLNIQIRQAGDHFSKMTGKKTIIKNKQKKNSTYSHKLHF